MSSCILTGQTVCSTEPSGHEPLETIQKKTIGKSNFCRNLSRKVWKKSYSTLRAFSAFNLFQQNTCSSFDTTDAKAATLTYWQAFAFSLGEEQMSIFACIQTVASLTRHDLLLVPHMMLIGSTIVFSHKHIAWSLEMQDLLVNWREQWHVSFFLELIDCWSYTSSTTPPTWRFDSFVCFISAESEHLPV